MIAISCYIRIFRMNCNNGKKYNIVNFQTVKRFLRKKKFKIHYIIVLNCIVIVSCLDNGV